MSLDGTKRTEIAIELPEEDRIIGEYSGDETVARYEKTANPSSTNEKSGSAGRNSAGTGSRRRFDRRRVLQGLGAVSVLGLAGCLGAASSEVHGRDEDDELASLDFGDHGEVDVRHLIPEEMTPTVQLVEDGQGNPVAVIAGSPGLTYEETVEFYRDADGGGDWSIADEGGEEEADGESGYSFAGTTDEFEAMIEITGFGSRNVALWIGIEPRH